MKYTVFTALAVAICATSAAHASTSSTSLTLNNFNLRAIDLLPNDGQSAGYAWLDEGGSTSAYIKVSAADAQAKVAGLFADLSLVPPSSTALSGSVKINDAGLALLLTSQNEVSSGYDYGYIVASPAGYGSSIGPTIRIAPGTGLVASWNYTVALDSSCPTTSRCDTAVALNAKFDLGDFNSQASFDKSFELQHGSYSLTSALGAISYFNFTNQYQDVVLRINATAGLTINTPLSTANISAVPEPAMFGLLAAGLLPVVAWRRRQGAGKPTAALAQ